MGQINCKIAQKPLIFNVKKPQYQSSNSYNSYNRTIDTCSFLEY